jgi:1-deoxy-D-xylulose-5-phosphate reductoisomerase
MGPRIISGDEAIRDAIRSSPATHTLAAMSGFAGLEPTLTALECGMTVLLANKETLVAAGDLVRRTAREYHGALVPVDSEHSAIFQCLALPQPIRRLVLTCSGGPFRGRTLSELESVAVEDALRHPNWSMGPKITIDSATLMNKGLEVIEAHYLFGADYDAIDVVIHPQSVVHSMVEFVDGATLAQCGWPDMRVPIAVALWWPDRLKLSIPAFSWDTLALTFEPVDHGTFALLDVAKAAGRQGGLYPAVLNAANEVAVAAFLDRRIKFLEIQSIIEEILMRFRGVNRIDDVEEILEVDRWARREATQILA